MNPHLSLDRIHNQLSEDLAADRKRKELEEAAKRAELEFKQREQTQEAAAVVEIAEEDPFKAFVRSERLPEEETQQRAAPPIPREPASQHQASVSAPDKVYAKPPTPQQTPTRMDPVPGAYRVADLRKIATPAQDRFYDLDYRRTLAATAEHVIQVEGPVFKEIVITRIREAHGFQRARDQIRDIITRAIGSGFNTSEEPDGRVVLWPRHLTPDSATPWRGLGGRNHGDVPAAELAGLAAVCDAGGLDEEGIIRAMQGHLQLGRLSGLTRGRFEEAVKRMRAVGSG